MTPIPAADPPAGYSACRTLDDSQIALLFGVNGLNLMLGADDIGGVYGMSVRYLLSIYLAQHLLFPRYVVIFAT
jgi:hypothetical protein